MRNSNPETIKEVIERHPLFFSKPLSQQEKQKRGLRHAKLTLIADIMDTMRTGGLQPSGNDFDELYDLDLDHLHLEMIKAQDRAFFK